MPLQKTKQQAGGRSAALESLRGIAAFIVFLGHFTMAFAPQRHGYQPGAIPGGNLMETPAFFIINGSACVSLFFVLSGFVLAFGYFADSRRPVVDAVIKRWPRLMPLALASALLSWFCIQLGLLHHAQAAALTHSEWLASFGYASRTDIAATSFFTAVVYGGFLVFFRSIADAWLNTSLWTMHLELLGSFLVFGLVAVLRQADGAKAAGVFVVVAVLAYFGNAYLPLFVAGAALAFLHQRHAFALRRRNGFSSLLLLTGVLLALGYMDPARGIYGFARRWQPYEPDLRIFCHGVAALVLIHMALVDARIHAFLSRRPLQFLGYISFPLYVMHAPLIFSLSSGLFVWLLGFLEYRAAVLLTLGGTLLLLLPLSLLLGHLDRRWCDFLKRPRKAEQLSGLTN